MNINQLYALPNKKVSKRLFNKFIKNSNVFNWRKNILIKNLNKKRPELYIKNYKKDFTCSLMKSRNMTSFEISDSNIKLMTSIDNITKAST